MLRLAMLLLWLLTAAVASAQAPPLAPTSCANVFAVLRQSPVINIWWSTHRSDASATVAGISQLQVGLVGSDLVGTGPRQNVYWNGYQPPPTEQVSLRIRADGKITVKEGGQAFVPECWSERFFTVHTGDSIEVFNVRLR